MERTLHSEIDQGHGRTHMTGNRPGHGGTHFAVWKLIRDVAEHTLPTKNQHGTWRNTLCRLEIDLERGRTHCDDLKSTWDMAEHTLLTGN